MSIVSMVDNKVVQEKNKANPPPVPGTPVGVPSNVVNQLVAYIPTEVVTVWVALITVLNDPKPPAGKAICHADWSGQWKLALGMAAVSTLLTLGFAWRKFADTAGVTFKWPLFGMVAAPVAFLAWAIALPQGPLRSACWFTEEAGGVILLVVTVAIATAAYIFGQGTRFEKI